MAAVFCQKFNQAPICAVWVSFLLNNFIKVKTVHYFKGDGLYNTKSSAIIKRWKQRLD